MSINQSVFKAYDIRGKYPTDIDEKFAFSLGQAVAVFIKKDSLLSLEEIKIGVSRDMRLSSPQLTENLKKGLTDQGVTVVDFGLLSTPSFYFAIDKYDCSAGVQVSASHNPAEYNGFKIVRSGAVPVSGETGLMELKELMLANEFQPVVETGTIITVANDEVMAKQIQEALQTVELEKLKPFKIVIDTANAMGGPLMEQLFTKLSSELVKLNFELDGRFPNHESDPLKDENNKQLQTKVIAEKADFGVALDGDADRIFLVDNLGQTVEPAIVRGILAKIFLQEYPSAKICYDIRPGKITEDMILENGGEPIVTKVGHSLIKEKARQEGAVFAGESSGHFFVKDGDHIYERPIIVLLKILAELSQADQSLSDYIKPLQKYFHSGEINSLVEDKEAVLEKLKDKYKDNLKYDFDGVSFEWPDYWFNVRPSNTENKLRLNLEAVSSEIMEQKRDEILQLIRSK